MNALRTFGNFYVYIEVPGTLRVQIDTSGNPQIPRTKGLDFGHRYFYIGSIKQYTFVLCSVRHVCRTR